VTALSDRQDERERAGTTGLARITQLAVADPETSYSQQDVLAMLGLDGDEFATRVFDRCAVESRDLGASPGTFTRTLQGRTAQTEDQLFEYAVRTVASLDIDPADICTVVTASLYSLGGPTLAHRLIEHFRMDPATDKYHIVGVGCASAVPLIRLVAQSLHDHPGKKGLIVAAESMSGLLSHASPGDQRAKTVGSAIFGDGAAAMVIENGTSTSGPMIVGSKVHQIEGTLGAVRMELSDDNSYLHLDRELPDLAAAGLAALVDDFLAPHGLDRDDIDHWVVHPGGRRILECVRDALSLSREQVEASYTILARKGNVGTPSIFYVLAETIRSRRPAAGERALLVTVGPGITVGLMLLSF
jgi:alkylresorcinol/alkylpyrone synthase